MQKTVQNNFVSRWDAFKLIRLVCLLAGILVVNSPCASAQAPKGWKELKGQHFVIYHAGPPQVADGIMRAAERYYERIAKNLGYQRLENFWLFDDRCRIYIYPSREKFHQNQPQAPEWSGGYADYERHRIISFADSEHFLTTALPHEIAHLILRDYLGAEADLPMWLDEGVALSQEERRRGKLESLVWSSFQERSFIPISKLTKMRVRLSRHHSKVQLYYAQSALLVDFLIRNSKSGEFVKFCRGLRDGFTVDQALKRAYSGRLKSVVQLEKSFLRDLASQFR